MRAVDTKGERKKSVVNNKIIYFFLTYLLSSCIILKPNNYLLKSNLDLGNIYKQEITSSQLYDYLSVLASDEYEGRETTFPGQKKAAEYLKNKLINWEILSPKDNGKYFQEFKVEVNDFSNVNLIINNDTLAFIEEYYSFGNPYKTKENNLFTVDAGFGIVNESFNSYKNLTVKDRVVILREGIPNNNDFKISDGNWRKKVETAKNNGALAVIFSKENYLKSDLSLKNHLKYPRMKMHNNLRTKQQIPVFFVDKEVLNNYATKTISLSTNVKEIKTAENVIGFIPGNSEELIVISAHYDHIGYDQGEICNGADDDGSGTVSLLSIAKAFQKAYNEGNKPERGILFLMVSGEEKGLFGSKYYTENPVFPLKNTVVDLNIDMIGRQDTIQPNNNYIYLIGSDKISKQLHIINEQVNNNFINFKLDYTYNSEDDPNKFYYRSDHYNFAKNNIPVIFYFGGLHEDYHKPTDEVDKIDFNKLEKTSRYIFLTAWELAYRKKRIK